jgi:hypothetical protein
MSPTKKQAEQPEPVLFEVLTKTANGHRTVHRLYAIDQAAAVAEIEALLDPGSEVCCRLRSARASAPHKTASTSPHAGFDSFLPHRGTKFPERV